MMNKFFAWLFSSSQPKQEFPHYKIFQNGYGKFKVEFLADHYGDKAWYIPGNDMFLTLRLNECKTIEEVHQAVKDYDEHLNKSKFKKVWP